MIEARVEARGRNLKGAILRWLAAGHSRSDALQLTARRSDTDAVVATLTTATRSLPTVRASLGLPDAPRIDFVPTNRPEHWREPVT